MTRRVDAIKTPKISLLKCTPVSLNQEGDVGKDLSRIYKSSSCIEAFIKRGRAHEEEDCIP